MPKNLNDGAGKKPFPGLKSKLLKIKFWHWTWLGLDAPCVALTWSYYLAIQQDINIPWFAYSSLFLSVWCIYLADRLYDIKSNTSIEHLSSRHFFTYNNQKWLMVLVRVIAILLIGHSLFFKIQQLIEIGILILLTLIYFWIVHSSKSKTPFFKETLSTPIFAAGVLLPIYIFHPQPLQLFYWGFLLTLLVFQNLIQISYWEKEKDLHNGSASILQKVTLLNPVTLFIIIQLIFLYFAKLTEWHFPTLPFWISSCLMFMLHLIKSRISENHLRFLIDFSLLSPLAFCVL